MPRIAGRPNLARERFTVYFDSTDLERADRLADQLNADVPDGAAKVVRSDVIRAATKLALDSFPELTAGAVRQTHPSLRPREAATP